MNEFNSSLSNPFGDIEGMGESVSITNKTSSGSMDPISMILESWEDDDISYYEDMMTEGVSFGNSAANRMAKNLKIFRKSAMDELKSAFIANMDGVDVPASAILGTNVNIFTKGADPVKKPLKSPRKQLKSSIDKIRDAKDGSILKEDIELQFIIGLEGMPEDQRDAIVAKGKPAFKAACEKVMKKYSSKKEASFSQSSFTATPGNPEVVSLKIGANTTYLAIYRGYLGIDLIRKGVNFKDEKVENINENGVTMTAAEVQAVLEQVQTASADISNVVNALANVNIQ